MSGYIMDTYIFRHGESPYAQGIVSLKEADDLTPDGVVNVKDSASHLGQRLSRDFPVEIHSSPFGRCLHTARIIGNTLSDLRFRVSGITEDSTLSEVENFDWGLFLPLVVGGELEYGSERFTVDDSLTNPQGLSSVRYFRSDSAHGLSQGARKTLPREYLERIDSFERYPSVSGRLDTKLKALSDVERTRAVPVICTHEALTGRFAEDLTGSPKALLGRGKYFGVRSEDGTLVPINYQKGALISEGN